MLDKIRFAPSLVFAAALTFVTFIGMSLLIAPSGFRKTTDLEIGDFTSIKEMQAPVTKTTPDKNTPPKQEKVKQPPATPNFDVAKTFDRTEIKLPQGVAKTNLEDLTLNNFPNMKNTDFGTGLEQDLTSILAIQPMYPQKALLNKIEGWVEVEFTINEFGNVVSASVINSKPTRVFNLAALKAIKKSKFKPLMIDGKAQSQTATQVYEFKLD